MTDPEIRYYRLSILVIWAFSLLRLAYISAGFLELAADEALYWNWSRHLDWSYISKGPAIAYLIALTTSLIGNTELGIRFAAPLLSLGAGYLMLATSRSMGMSSRAGFHAVVLLNIIPLFTAGGILMTPDTPLFFCWALGFLVFWNLISKQEISARWAALGFIIGVGFLAKFTMVLFVFCMVIIIILDRDCRAFIKRKGIYLCLFIVVLCCFPVLYWNYKHGFVTFRFLWELGGGHRGLHFDFKHLAEFILGQVGVVSPILFVLMAISLTWGFRNYLNEGDKRGLVLASFSVPVLSLFLLKSIQSPVYVNWPSVGYYTGILSLAAWEDRKSQNSRLLKAFYRTGIVFAFLLSLLALSFPVFPRFGIHLPINIDPTTKQLGWRELALRIESMPSWRKAPPGKKPFILTEYYSVTSAMAFYLEGHPQAYLVNVGQCGDSEYDYWPTFNRHIGEDCIYVRRGDGDIEQKIRGAFECIEPPTTWILKNGSYEIKRFKLFDCHTFRGMNQ
jgi:4-amino-4-deoxy-L-arabinose transferase-like glycosyltransferase